MKPSEQPYFTATFDQPLNGEIRTCPGPRVGSRRYFVEIHSIVVRAGAVSDIHAQATWVNDAGQVVVEAKFKTFGPRQKPRNHVLSFTPDGAHQPVADPMTHFLTAAKAERDAMEARPANPDAILLRVTLPETTHD